MKKSVICLGVLAGIVTLCPFLSAASPYVKSREVAIRSDVDKALAADWKQKGLFPVTEASDSLLVRRLYLDLTGRLPSVEDAKSFVYSKDSGKYLSGIKPEEQAAILDWVKKTTENLQ